MTHGAGLRLVPSATAALPAAGKYQSYGVCMETSSGLQTDCEALLSRFQEMDSVRFEDFTELWRKMKFGTIFW